MIRITTLLWVALLVVAGGTVMHVSYQVRRVQQHLAELARTTHDQQDAIRILDAEWDTLNDPHRIDELSKRYLTLQPTPIQRVVALDAVPLKLSEDQLEKLNAALPKAAAAKKTDPTIKAPRSAPASPNVIAAARRATPQPLTAANTHTATPSSGVDGVGLILARVERHE
jgi:cell division protein FtsL